MFSKACEYGLRATLYLAQHSEESVRVGVDELAERLTAPRHFLAKVLQQLARADVISSAKGPRGGFYLSQHNVSAPLLGVVECLDGPIKMQGCVMGLPKCTSENPCPLHHATISYRDTVRYQLGAQSIAEIAIRVETSNLFTQPQSKPTFPPAF